MYVNYMEISWFLYSVLRIIIRYTMLSHNISLEATFRGLHSGPSKGYVKAQGDRGPFEGLYICSEPFEGLCEAVPDHAGPFKQTM